jgi:hypothetical protein
LFGTISPELVSSSIGAAIDATFFGNQIQFSGNVNLFSPLSLADSIWNFIKESAFDAMALAERYFEDVKDSVDVAVEAAKEFFLDKVQCGTRARRRVTRRYRARKEEDFVLGLNGIAKTIGFAVGDDDVSNIDAGVDAARPGRLPDVIPPVHDGWNYAYIHDNGTLTIITQENRDVYEPLYFYARDSTRHRRAMDHFERRRRRDTDIFEQEAQLHSYGVPAGNKRRTLKLGPVKDAVEDAVEDVTQDAIDIGGDIVQGGLDGLEDIYDIVSNCFNF